MARPRSGRAEIVLAMLRPLVVAVIATSWYFMAPMDQDFGVAAIAELLGGLVVLGVVVGWQIREITRSEHPRWRAIGVLLLSFPLVILLFAATYFLLERDTGGSFNQPLTRIDALYFTLVVFTTVGFGDVVAKSQVAKCVVMIQMVVNLTYIGLLARVLVGAVQVGVNRRSAGAG